jgi:preprotein translocase subunit SecB
MADNDQAAAQGEGEKKGIQPQKIYLKDVSFETPNSPGIFTLDWKPNVEIEIDNKSAVLADDLHEVVLTLTVTVKVGERTAFLAEIHQAGIFVMRGLDPEELQRAQHVFCMRMLYPYASAALTEMVTKGGFPQLLLAPVNFEGLYAQRQQAAAASAGTSEA